MQRCELTAGAQIGSLDSWTHGRFSLVMVDRAESDFIRGLLLGSRSALLPAAVVLSFQEEKHPLQCRYTHLFFWVRCKHGEGEESINFHVDFIFILMGGKSSQLGPMVISSQFLSWFIIRTLCYIDILFFSVKKANGMANVFCVQLLSIPQ